MITDFKIYEGKITYPDIRLYEGEEEVLYCRRYNSAYNIVFYDHRFRKYKTKHNVYSALSLLLIIEKIKYEYDNITVDDDKKYNNLIHIVMSDTWNYNYIKEYESEIFKLLNKSYSKNKFNL